MTQFIRGLAELQRAPTGAVVTIGNFDGVHLGHQHLLRVAREAATAAGKPLIAIVFEPHPQTFFRPDDHVPRLSRLRDKFTLLADNGVDTVVVLRFTAAFADWSATHFVYEVLVNGLHASQIVVGDDFRFGRMREGTLELLRIIGHQAGFSLTTVPGQFADGERISSTRIRTALVQGNFAAATALLGRPWQLSGRIAWGAQRGRQLGFPTANIFPGKSILPVHGVYAVCVEGIDDQVHQGVANIGERPTVEGKHTLLEVNLFDFNKQIYGKRINVTFCAKLRDEQRFANLDELQAQIKRDAAAAKAYFMKGECSSARL